MDVLSWAAWLCGHMYLCILSTRPGLQPRYEEKQPPSLPNISSTLSSSWSLASLPSPTQAATAVFADAIGLQPDARGVATSLGLNERLFVVNPQEVHELVGTRQGARAQGGDLF